MTYAGEPGQPPSRQRASAIVYSAAEYTTSVIVLLAVTPYYVHGLGPAAYGVWAWLMAVNLLLYQMADPGFLSAGIRLLAQLDRRRDQSSVSEVVGTVLVANLVIGALIGMLLWGSADVLVIHILHAPPTDSGEVAGALRVSAWLPLLTFARISYAGVLRAFLHFKSAGLITAAHFILFYGGGAWSLGRHHSVGAVVSWQLVASGVSALLMAGYSTKVIPPSAPVRLRLRSRTGRLVAMDGRAFFLMSSLDAVTTYGQRMLLAGLAGAAALAYFVPEMTLAAGVFGLLVKALFVVFPASSRLHREADRAGLHELYLVSSRVAHVIALAGVLPLGLIAAPFLEHWLGADAARMGTSVLVLGMAGALFVSFMVVPHYVLNGVGLSRLNGLCVLLTAVVALVGSAVLVPRWGAAGAAAALAIGYGSACPVVIRLVEERALEMPLTQSARALYLPAGVSAVLAAPVIVGLGSLASSSAIATGLALGGSSAIVVGLNIGWAALCSGDPLHPLVDWARRALRRPAGGAGPAAPLPF